jgi:tight adherence protein B
MNLSVALFLLLGFLAVVLLIEGLYVLWKDKHSPEVRRLNERLKALSSDDAAPAARSQLLKQRVLSQHPALQALLLRLPFVQSLDRLLLQAGQTQTVAHQLSLSALTGLGGALLGVLLRWPALVTLGLMLLAGAWPWPWLWLMRKRKKRLEQLEAQLPEVMDLMSRALRAGHAFPSALGMVATEAAEPIAGEFRITTDEIGFGVSVDNALGHMAERVPSPDMRYFVMAVVIQRQTGGNLSELLGKLAELVRERFKLFAKVRVLAAEGKLSAYILTGLPFCVGLAIQVMNPDYLSVLFTDPSGIRVVYGAMAMMGVGIFVMWRTIAIKV